MSGTVPEPGNVLTGCLYETDGAICGEKVRARGYCMKHYKVMQRAGAFKPDRQISGGQDAVARNVGHLDRARLLLQEHTEELVRILLDAARKAAKRGDSKPAEWALLHSRTLEPVLTGGAATSKGKDDSAGGVRVIIGVNLSTPASLGAPAPQASTSTSHLLTSASVTSSPEPSASLPGAQSAILLPSSAGLPDPALPTLPTLDAQLIP